MVERIVKVDSGTNRVQETQDDEGRHGGQQQEEEEKKREKDKFEMADKPRLPTGASSGKIPESPESEAEASFTMSQRILVLWGILDMKGKPRVPVIVTYGVVAAVILTSLIVILNIIWR